MAIRCRRRLTARPPLSGGTVAQGLSLAYPAGAGVWIGRNSRARPMKIKQQLTQTYRVLGLIRGDDFDGVQLKPVNGDDVARLGADSIRLDYGHGLRPGDVVQISVRVLQRSAPAEVA